MKDQDILRDVLSILEPYPLNDTVACALSFCFRNPYEGVLVTDKDGIIQFMDRPSEKFFGLAPGGALGIDITQMLPMSDFKLVITTGTPIIGRIREIGGITRIGSVYPLKKRGEVIGAIGRVVFHSFQEIDKRNKEIQDLKSEVRYLRQKQENDNSSLYRFDNILGVSKSIKQSIAMAKRISMLDADVLIVGESGTGKELFAHGIHGFSHANKPFVKINCPAIPFELAESQFFGYEKGTFTGAIPSGKAGIFEIAHNGMVFLDEISSLPLSIQAKLLRVLQEREIQRLGSSKTKKVNFRFIAATNMDLFKLVEEGRFRHDLYYRVARATLQIAPLRERREDILLYIDHFLKAINKSFNTRLQEFSEEAMNFLLQYDWPGNVRQVIHVLEQIAIKAWDSQEITLDHLPREILFPEKHSVEDKSIGCTFGIKQEVAFKEKDSIISALNRTGGNKRQAALLLKMPRSTFYQKIKKYHIF